MQTAARPDEVDGLERALHLCDQALTRLGADDPEVQEAVLALEGLRTELMALRIATGAPSGGGAPMPAEAQ